MRKIKRARETKRYRGWEENGICNVWFHGTLSERRVLNHSSRSLPKMPDHYNLMALSPQTTCCPVKSCLAPWPQAHLKWGEDVSVRKQTVWDDKWDGWDDDVRRDNPQSVNSRRYRCVFEERWRKAHLSKLQQRKYGIFFLIACWKWRLGCNKYYLSKLFIKHSGFREGKHC